MKTLKRIRFKNKKSRQSKKHTGGARKTQSRRHSKKHNKKHNKKHSKRHSRKQRGGMRYTGLPKL